jgi:hypothetical protein
MRHDPIGWMTPTHTLIHLDGIAWGSLLAIGLHTLPLSRRDVALDGPGRIRAGRSGGGHDCRRHGVSRLGAGGGLCRRGAGRDRIDRRAQSAERVLRRGPLAFYGRISYGLYMTHISVFIYFGWFDAAMDPTGWRATWRWWPSGWRRARRWRGAVVWV